MVYVSNGQTKTPGRGGHRQGQRAAQGHAQTQRAVHLETNRELMLSKTLEDAIEQVLIGGNHLALLIGADHPSYHASAQEALEHYYLTDNMRAYDVWCCWKNIMQLRDKTGK